MRATLRTPIMSQVRLGVRLVYVPAPDFIAQQRLWFWYARWLRVFAELGVPLRCLGASGRFASWALELRGGGNGDRDDQRQRDDRQMHPTSGGVEQLVPAGPIGFRLRRVTCSRHDPLLRRPRLGGWPAPGRVGGRALPPCSTPNWSTARLPRGLERCRTPTSTPSTTPCRQAWPVPRPRAGGRELTRRRSSTTSTVNPGRTAGATGGVGRPLLPGLAPGVRSGAGRGRSCGWSLWPVRWLP